MFDAASADAVLDAFGADEPLSILNIWRTGGLAARPWSCRGIVGRGRNLRKWESRDACVVVGVWVARGRRTGGGTLCGLFVVVVLRPWLMNRGSTPEERAMVLPGDTAPPETSFTRAITIETPPSAVWPWLLAIGQDRAGFPSNDYLEQGAHRGGLNEPLNVRR